MALLIAVEVVAHITNGLLMDGDSDVFLETVAQGLHQFETFKDEIGVIRGGGAASYIIVRKRGPEIMCA